MSIGGNIDKQYGKLTLLARLVAALFSLGTSFDAASACDKGTKTIFFCVAAKGNVIQVCDSGKTIDYSFGKTNALEVVVRAPRSDASTFQWQGAGQFMPYAIRIPNGNTTYSVYWVSDRYGYDKPHKVNAGVHVVTNGKTESTVNCTNAQSIVQNMEGLDLKRADSY